jgi:1-acyl-sn-glycerol-3-phosphate acyltransferase
MTSEIKHLKQVPFYQRLYFWTLIWIHVLRGVFTLLLVFPTAKTPKKNFHIQRWSQQLLRIFGIELRVCNQHSLPAGTYLLASNHVSWMDIHAINAYKPIRFVAKSEVRAWPIFGWMALQLRTVFIKRDSQRHAHAVVGEMSQELQSDSICIFPEGTSTNGESVHPFKPNLFESAITANVPVLSLAIRYISKETGRKTDTAAFVGEMGLLESMSKILKNRNLIVELSFLPPPSPSLEHSFDRKFLASYSENLIRKHVEGD